LGDLIDSAANTYYALRDETPAEVSQAEMTL
jgi:hypothetical protein